MNNAILMSFHPRSCELIAIGKRTVEVRKSKPCIELPTKVYIYQAKKSWVYNAFSKIADWQGKIIGEFVCDEITVAKCGEYCNIPLQKAQLDAYDLMMYADEKTVYGWHISELVIYNEPRELSEFSHICSKYWQYDDFEKCGGCEYYFCDSNPNVGRKEGCSCDGIKPVTKPPHSWGYVEHKGEKQ